MIPASATMDMDKKREGTNNIYSVLECDRTYMDECIWEMDEAVVAEEIELYCRMYAKKNSEAKKMTMAEGIAYEKHKNYLQQRIVEQIKFELKNLKSAKKNEDYTGAINHLRVGAELLCLEILIKNKVPYSEFIDLNQSDRLDLIDFKELLKTKEIGLLHRIRKVGNSCMHPSIDVNGHKLVIMTNREAHNQIEDLLPEYKIVLRQQRII